MPWSKGSRKKAVEVGIPSLEANNSTAASAEAAHVEQQKTRKQRQNVGCNIIGVSRS